MEAQRESKMPNWLVVLANKLTNMVKVAGVICRSVGAGGISATPRPATIHSEPLVPTKMPITYCGRRVTGETQRKLLEMLVSSPSATPQELDEHLGLRNIAGCRHAHGAPQRLELYQTRILGSQCRHFSQASACHLFVVGPGT